VSENSPADYVRLVVDNVLDSNPSSQQRASAELLQEIVDTWKQQPGWVRRQAVAAAQDLSPFRRR
jgi:hypothetical protein